MASISQRAEPTETSTVVTPTTPRLRRRISLSQPLTYGLLTLACALILGPFVWLLSASFKTDAQYYADPIIWLPSPLNWHNYTIIFSLFHLGTFLFNSLWLAAYAVIVNVLVCSFIAYGFARFQFPGRNVLFLILLATLIFPTQVLTIPLFKTFRDLGWLGTFLPILVPRLFGFGATLEIFLLRQFFLRLPRELDEAASLDGAGSFRIFWSVILPQSRPVLIVVAIFSFLDSWRDAWGPLIYLNDSNLRTLPIGLFTFLSGENTVEYPPLMAATLISLIVPVIIYLIGQRYIDNGVVIGSSK